MTRVNLYDLKNIAEELSDVQCNFYCEACSIAFQKNDHVSETQLTVDGHYQGTFKFSWNQVNELAGWQDYSVVAENAAIAIAIFLIAEFTEYTMLGNL